MFTLRLKLILVIFWIRKFWKTDEESQSGCNNHRLWATIAQYIWCSIMFVIMVKLYITCVCFCTFIQLTKSPVPARYDKWRPFRGLPLLTAAPG